MASEETYENEFNPTSTVRNKLGSLRVATRVYLTVITIKV